MSLALIIAFAALLLLLLLALIWSHWPGWLKLLLTVFVTGMYFYGYDVVHRIWGIPSTDALPERFIMLSAVVEEPNSKNPGAVYVWVTEPREGKAMLEPRAYKLPYNRELHTQIDEGQRKGKDGVSQMGTAEGRPGSGKGLGFLRPGNDEQEIKIRDLPTPQMPEK
jgi:hypothetical protein